MMQDEFFSDKQILVVDADEKNQNDRTWCFWERQTDIFEPIVHHQWETLDFFSASYSKELNIAPYLYKMIRGIDFYQYVKAESAKHLNIHWLKDRILSLDFSVKNLPGIVLADKIIYASQIFNSILFEPIKADSHQYHFLQHFKGWMIRSRQECFDPNRATFMDFRVGQQHGTTFMYVLPTSTTTALVEYTLFTESLLELAEYEQALRDYIQNDLGIADYVVEHEEYGIIPMTNARLLSEDRGVVYIGIAGGQAKASSGFAFRFIQKRTSAIVKALRSGRRISPRQDFSAQKGLLYDSTLLHVLHHKKMKGDEVFTSLFRRSKPSDVLAFLDNESSLLTDLRIMSAVPTKIFLPAAIKELRWFF